MMRTSVSSGGMTILSGTCDFGCDTFRTAVELPDESSRAWAKAVPLIPRPAAAASPTPAYVILVKRIARLLTLGGLVDDHSGDRCCGACRGHLGIGCEPAPSPPQQIPVGSRSHDVPAGMPSSHQCVPRLGSGVRVCGAVAQPVRAADS